MMTIKIDNTSEEFRSKALVIAVGDVAYCLTERDGWLTVNLHHKQGPMKALGVVGAASNSVHLTTVEL